MRGFLLALVGAVLIGAGAGLWVADRRADRVNAKFDALQAELQAERAARATDAAAAAAGDRVRVVERTIVREVEHGRAQIQDAVGADALVSADVDRAGRCAILRMRDPTTAAGAGCDDRNPASPSGTMPAPAPSN